MAGTYHAFHAGMQRRFLWRLEGILAALRRPVEIMEKA